MRINREPDVTEIADSVFAVNAPFEDVPNTVYVVVGDTVTLVDSGVSTTPSEYLLPALHSIGVSPQDVRLVLNTHGHHDHQGGNAAVLEEAPEAVVGCHPADEAWIRSVPTYLKDMYQSLGPYWELSESLEERIRRLTGEPVTATVSVNGGDRLELGPGQTLIAHHVPAHSPGHLVFEHEQSRLLFTGDALQAAGTPLAARPNFFPFYYSVDAYLDSLRLFEDVDPILTGTAHHGIRNREEMQGLVDQSRELLGELRTTLRTELARRDTLDLRQALEAVSTRWPTYAMGSQIIRTTRAHLKELVGLGEAVPGEQPDSWRRMRTG